MQKIFAAALGSVVALVGFAGAANASATLSLLWDGTDTEVGRLTEVFSSELIVLHVILTAGSRGVSSLSVTTDFTEAFTNGTVSVDSFLCVPGVLPCISDGFDDFIPGQIVAMAVGATGAGLSAGATDLIGTVTFHVDSTATRGTFEIRPLLTAGIDEIFDSVNLKIANDTVFFESASLVNVPEPGAVAMLVIGLGGMLLAGRGRRS